MSPYFTVWDSTRPQDAVNPYDSAASSDFYTVWDSTRPQDAVNPYDSAASSDFYTFMQNNAAKGTQGIPANIAMLYSVPLERSMRASHQA